MRLSVPPHLSYRKLRRLDMGGLPNMHNPGLMRILVEEMLPHCLVAGEDYTQGLEDTTQTDDSHTSKAPGAQP